MPDALAALVTPLQVSQASKGKVSATDPRVQPLLDGASAAVRRYCGWHVAPKISETVTLDTDGEWRLPLPSLHVVSVDSIRLDGVELTGWRLSKQKAMVEFATPLPCRYAALQVTMVHGFDAAPDVVSIITQVVLAALASPMGATAESAGGVSVTWAQTAPGVAGGLSLLQRDLDLLDMYRLHGRP